MEDKYYKPEEKEFHIGFEYEDNYNNKWQKTTYYPCDFLDHDSISVFNESELRVKFLDESDLEELGWDVHEKGIEKKVVGGEWRVHNLEPGTLRLQYSDDVDWEAGFDIENVKIKNKSEMRKLMEMLNIV